MNLGLLHTVGLCSALTVILLSTSCIAIKRSSINQAEYRETMVKKDINVVLREHEKELLAIPSVVGVYVGLLPDDKTLCLKVMVTQKTEELKKMIPKSIDGHQVLIEESGTIRPLR